MQHPMLETLIFAWFTWTNSSKIQRLQNNQFMYLVCIFLHIYIYIYTENNESVALSSQRSNVTDTHSVNIGDSDATETHF